jgi:hypothetical protein
VLLDFLKTFRLLQRNYDASSEIVVKPIQWISSTLTRLNSQGMEKAPDRSQVWLLNSIWAGVHLLLMKRQKKERDSWA